MGNSLCKGPGVGGALVPPKRIRGWGQTTQSHGKDSGLYFQGVREVVVGFQAGERRNRIYMRSNSNERIPF